MQQCPQTDTQSVYQHGVSVKDHTFALIQMLQSGEVQAGWILPNWFFQYRKQILAKLLPFNIIEEYTIYHDCSKPQCRIVDENGKQHFPNHAQLSGELWLEVGGNKEAATLMSMDMDIHNLKDIGVNEFSNRPQAVTLLLVGLAEIHSNAIMFGGLDSVSFKIKYKQINKRGKAMLEKLFKKQNEKTGLCPCSGQCCSNPEIFTPEHTCEESVCEDCFDNECKNCGSWCCCDL